MPEIKRIVRPVEVNYICDACGEGMMEQIGEMDAKTGDIEHKCMICDQHHTFQWKHYPRIEHVGENETP